MTLSSAPQGTVARPHVKTALTIWSVLAIGLVIYYVCLRQHVLRIRDPRGEVYGAVALTAVTLGGLLAALVIRVMTAFLHRPAGGGSPPARAPGALPGFRRVDLRQPRAFVGWVARSYPLPLERGT